MEKYFEQRELALKALKAADHILTQTYPLVRDPKLLLAVLDNVFLSAEHTMSAMLYYDRMFKKIPPFHESFESKFNVFKMRCAPHNNLNRHASLVMELRELMNRHKQSPVEFSRKDAFIICDDDYRIRTITLSDLKSQIARTKAFFSDVDKITSEHEGILNRSE